MVALAVAVATAVLAAQIEVDPPFALPPTVEMVADVVYARPDGRDLHADLFVPRARNDGVGRAAAIYIFGGGWRSGDKHHFRRQAAHLAALGIVGMCIEYRLSDEARFPAALEDAKAAVRWLRVNAATYGVDPDRIGAVGGSAGGHLAALVGTVPGRYNDGGGNAGVSSAVAAVVAFNPVLDLIGLAAEQPDVATAPDSPVVQFLGATWRENPRVWMEASPLVHASPSSARFLLLHGTADRTVPYTQSIDLQRRLGARAELFTAEGAGHGFFNQPPWFAPTLAAMERFLLDALAPG